MKRYFHILPLALAAVFPAEISAQGEIQRAEIKPLLKTEWGQQAPYNYLTPVIDGEHAKTGCVATAFSQVLYYYAYPRQGKPEVFTNTGSTGDFSFDFSKNTFDYDLMKVRYEDNVPESDESALEVSKLMLAAGVTVNMNYGVSSSSGTFSMIPKVLGEWYLYPTDGMGQLSKDCFTNSEWEQVIYEELAAGRPVLYLGGNGLSSHVFVCDGYKDGLFHMNWGWYGQKNGYYSLNNLQVERVGDGTILSLNSAQRIVRGVRLANQSIPGPLATASSVGYDDGSKSFTITNISCFSDNTVVIPGLRVFPADGSKSFEIWAPQEVTLGTKNSNISFSIDLSAVEEGKYQLRPVYRLASDGLDSPGVYNVYCNIQNSRFFNAEIFDHDFSSIVGATDLEVNVAISEYTQNSSFIKGETYNQGFTVFAENVGNANITRFGIRLCKPGETASFASTNYAESLAPGESKTIPLGLPTVDPGEYDLVIFDNSSKTDFCEPIRIIIHDGKKIVTVPDSPFRYMPLSDETKEATILYPKTIVQADETEGTVDINPTVVLNGSEYKITEIGPRLLYNRQDVSKLIIPEYVNKIDPSAFAGCSNLSDITVKAQTPPVVHSSSFDNSTVSTALLTVPDGSAEFYKTAPIWENFSYSDADESVTSLTMSSFKIAPGENATSRVTLTTKQEFFGCQFVITLPEGLTVEQGGVKPAEGLEDKKFTVVCSDPKEDGTYTVVMYSVDNSTYPTGTTDILDISFLSTPDFKGGNITLTDIIMSAADDNNLDKDVNVDSSTCIVSMDVSTGVQAMDSLDCEAVDIYNVSGILIRRGVLFDEAKHSLGPGLYILKGHNDSHKLLIP